LQQPTPRMGHRSHFLGFLLVETSVRPREVLISAR
jgi:hypothetical protein